MGDGHAFGELLRRVNLPILIRWTSLASMIAS
jgi:hypothetical protein